MKTSSMHFSTIKLTPRLENYNRPYHMLHSNTNYGHWSDSIGPILPSVCDLSGMTSSYSHTCESLLNYDSRLLFGITVSMD